MCRLLGYSGPLTDLRTLLYQPAHSLEHQSFAPTRMLSGVVNGDGWGVGWYDPNDHQSIQPARFRTTTPMWADRSFSEIAAAIRASTVVAAVRSATPPLPVETTSTPPFRSGRYLFALNGYIESFVEGRNEELRSRLSRRRASALEGTSDAEMVFAHILDRLDEGEGIENALRITHEHLTEFGPAPHTMLVSDGSALVALCWRNTLFTHADWGGGHLVASEPLDDSPGWDEVPDGATVSCCGSSLSVQVLDRPDQGDRP